MPHMKISVISGGGDKQDKALRAGFDGWVSVLRRPKSPELCYTRLRYKYGGPGQKYKDYRATV
jgi:hypothetical protein